MITEPGPTETVGQRLRRLRTEKKLSQRELSSPGVSYAYISRIEAGTRTPSVKALRMLARKLGVAPEYLETGAEIGQRDQREMRLADAELQLRFATDTRDAERDLRAVLADAAETGDAAHASRARVALGLAAAAAQRHVEAIALLETEVAAGTTPAAARPNVYLALARSYVASGMPDRAVELLRRCLDEVREHAPDDAALQFRYASHLSAALAAAGDADAAREALAGVLEAAAAAADPHTRVQAYWELARAHVDNGNPAFALDAYRRAVALLEATTDTIDVARAHVEAASTLIDDQNPTDAERHLDTAERLLGAAPVKADMARLRTEQARLAVCAGESANAVERAREALELLRDANPAEQAAAWLALAEALASGGDADGAGDAFRRSIDLFGAADRWRECARAYRRWGRLLRDAGRESEALDALERAADLAEHPRAEALSLR